jgi:hypothetical protein
VSDFSDSDQEDICRRAELIEAPRSKRVEKQIADIQEKSDKKRTEVSEGV